MPLNKPAAKPFAMRDLAEMFNVSKMTVSRALRGTGSVDRDLQAAIVEAARLHGYTIDTHYHARALARRRHGHKVVNNLICAIVHGTELSTFHTRVLRGIEQGAEESGNELIVVTNHTYAHLPRVISRGQVDGVIWVLSEFALKYFQPTCPVPLVSVFYTAPGADLVTMDEHKAMQAMGELLARRGHCRVAFVGSESELSRARLAGLRAGLAPSGGRVSDADVRAEPFVMRAPTILPLVRTLMDRWRAEPAKERFTAIAAYNDYMAVTIIRCLQDEYGLNVPGDISVTGFDGLNMADGAMPKLATVAIPLEEIGVESVRMILWRMQHQDEPPRRVALDAPLIEGETVNQTGVPLC